MCNPACIEFGKKYLGEKEVTGKRVLEVGALNVNGSLGDYIELLNPSSYVGIDLVMGIGVDQICPAELIVKVFGKESFDLVVCTEMLEHCKDWKLVIHNLKSVFKPGGTILITTRSKGFPRHDFPEDYWRFDDWDMKRIFSDCANVIVESDPSMPGVFVKATRTERLFDLFGFEVYSMEEENES
jgi:SAM-dependent methyltransferase